MSELPGSETESSPGASAPIPATPPAPAPVNTLDLTNKDVDKDPDRAKAIADEAKKNAKPKDEKSAPEFSGANVYETKYNPDEAMGETRQTITLWLIGLLCAIVGLSFVAVFARGAATGFTHPEFFREFKQVLDVLVGPIITLLASAIGFYFGYKQGELVEAVKNSNVVSRQSGKD